MELASGSLRDLVDSVQKSNDDNIKLTLSLITYCFVLKALEFLEAVNIVHGDIKPENFLIIPTDQYPWKFNIKLIDFGTIHVLDPGKSVKSSKTAISGTLVYMAPEVSFNFLLSNLVKLIIYLLIFR